MMPPKPHLVKHARPWFLSNKLTNSRIQMSITPVFALSGCQLNLHKGCAGCTEQPSSTETMGQTVLQANPTTAL